MSPLQMCKPGNAGISLQIWFIIVTGFGWFNNWVYIRVEKCSKNDLGEGQGRKGGNYYVWYGFFNRPCPWHRALGCV